MKTTAAVLSLLTAMLICPAAAQADSYDVLWKKVETEKRKDLPKSQMAVLKTIMAKAEKEKRYGHLLKAELENAALMVEIAPDSLQPAVDALVAKAGAYEGKDYALAAVYNAVLGRIYRECGGLGDGREERSREFFAKALADPARLASCKALEYMPLVVAGEDSRFFNNDLLSMIGYEAEDYKALHDYYAATGNRVATMLTALEMLRQRRRDNGEEKNYVASLDSLISIYSDLTECGELAIERYDYVRSRSSLPHKDIEYIDMALAKWGGWQNMNRLRNARKELTNPMFTVTMPRNVVLPMAESKVGVSVRNIGLLTMRVSRLNLNGDTKLAPENANDYKKIKSAVIAGSTITQTLSFKGKKEYETTADSMSVKGLPVGVYLLEFTTDNKGLGARRQLLYVTDLYVVSQQLPDRTYRVAVLSATTGQPVPGAMVYIKQYDAGAQTLRCDDKGELIYKSSRQRDLMIRPYTSGDKACPITSSWSSFSYYDMKNDNDIVSLYTDRSIYRPGQTVRVSAIAFNNSKGVNLKAVAGRSFTVTLRDANRKVVREKTVTTDEYGSASTDFVLPASGLTGRFTITSDYGLYGSTSIRVEQYKRPTFKVEFDDVRQAYGNGDTLTLTGRAGTFAGVPVQGAKVRYTVSRRMSVWGWRYGDMPVTATLNEGEAVTGADGTFTVRMPMVLPESETNTGNAENLYYKNSRFYNFTVLADVTDGSGETHSGDKVLTMGSKPVILDCDIAGMIERDSIKAVVFKLRNASGNEIPGNVTYYIDDVSRVFTAKANEPVVLQWGDGNVPVSGRHRLVATCGGDTVKCDFTVFSIDDKRPAYDMRSWFYTSARQFPHDGKPVFVQVGSSDEDVHILYTVISGDRLLESGVMEESNSLNTRRIEYRDEYGDGVLLTYVWVKNGKQYSYKTYIERPLPDKRLNLKWTTFRDKLVPGQSETWTLSVTKPDGTPADAQLLATMYDRSLDQIAPFNWFFNTYMRQNQPYTQWSDMGFNALHVSRSSAYKILDVKGLTFNRITFNSFISSMTTRGIRIRGRGKLNLMSKAEAASAQSFVSSEMKTESYDAVSTDEAEMSYVAVMKSPMVGSAANRDAGIEETGNGGQTTVQEQVRENLNETAFFYPALSTDADGNIGIRFTLPESVTTWKFVGLAHDKEMNNGMITGETVAKKDVMVQPNMPRFLRLGDKTDISSRIFNTSDKKVSGTVRMELIEPETGRVVCSGSKKFEVAAGETCTATFELNTSGLSSPDSELSTIYIYKVVASGKTFSDGEQHYLPILPDVEMVTNTMPFTINGAGTKTLDISRLALGGGRNSQVKPSDGKSRLSYPVRLTIEYTNNPAWMMVQALPSVSDADAQNAISLAASYYANSLGKYIIGQSPQIKTTFERWQQEQSEESSLMSSLDKNDELKALALDETPWVMDADNESDQKRALANFFDSNAIDWRLGTTLSALSKLQNNDGSFSWCKGMKGSPCMTAEVMEFLTRLDILTSGNNGTTALLNRANEYLGKVIVKEVEEMKRREKKGETISIYDYHALQYLYVNAISGRKLSAKEQAAADYLMEYLKKRKLSQSLYAKALMAVVLAKNGQQSLAAEYVRSLKEYTVFTEDMGRYYDTPRAGYSWCDYRIPTQVAVIEALQTVAPQDVTTVDEMRRWLLQEKRTQAWDTPVNSVNAIYAFLKGNMQVLSDKVNPSVAVDGKQVEMPKATAGLGYVKTSQSGDGVKTVSVTKTADGISWGAVYSQFMQSSSDIADASSGLAVTREIFPVASASSSLKVGDRVKVRITIKAFRDYDFVMVTDRRPSCLEPINQLSGYDRGYYVAPKDNVTNYYFDMMSKGTHVLETEYYVDRTGVYETGTCTVQCAYSPEYIARTKSQTLTVSE